MHWIIDPINALDIRTLLIRIDKQVDRIVILYGQLYVNSIYSRFDYSSLSIAERANTIGEKEQSYFFLRDIREKRY